jgi:hypothetical protein
MNIVNGITGIEGKLQWLSGLIEKLVQNQD